MPANNQLAVLDQIRALAMPQAQPLGKVKVQPLVANPRFVPRDATEATCLALAANHEKYNPSMKGILAATQQAILAERAKVDGIHDRIDGMERKMGKGFNAVANELARRD
jgi:hypothetical protein